MIPAVHTYARIYDWFVLAGIAALVAAAFAGGVYVGWRVWGRG